ncbi:hypothetical protein yc1106_08101 [Curvularia clavata]|uniref:Heterokaryon incompatibility domain-containing protein n=1 Tax=Curvularia clavata TaxID=95742 RepID=A0A9Q9DVG5_CURCL|nr:hypothetical protein yc1106_08101 [Curvularia clavata]
MGGNVNLELRRRQSTESDKIILAGHLAGQESSVFAEHQEPLSNRGWTFQEHLLARRTISFRATEITWACLNDTDVSSFRERYKPLSRRSTSIQFNTDREFWSSGWANLINDFTKRTLRYPRDRLPALAGIAQRWADGLNDVYVAGLWRSSLPLTLLWYVRDCEPALGINDKLPAPSWSWAAVSKPVHLQSEPGNVLCAECLEVDITRGSSDSVFGAVAEGVLKLRGILTPVSLTHSPQHSGGYIVFINDDGSGDYQIRTCLAMLDRDVDVETEGLFVLAIAKALDLRGLLVLKNPDGTFSRLGFVMTTGDMSCWLIGGKDVIDLT